MEPHVEFYIGRGVSRVKLEVCVDTRVRESVSVDLSVWGGVVPDVDATYAPG